MKKITTALMFCIAISIQAQTTAPDELTGSYSTCTPGKSNSNRDAPDLPNAVNVGTIDDRTCYSNYTESTVNGLKWGVYNITDGSNHYGTSLQPRMERSLARAQKVGVGSYVHFKGTVRILEVGNTSGTVNDGTYMMQTKGKHTGGGGTPDPAIALYLVKPVLDKNNRQVSFKLYREQIKVRGGEGNGREIVFLMDIGKNVPTDVDLKVGFRQDPNNPSKRIHYSDAIIGGKVFKWNIPQPERGTQSGIRYGAYRVKGGRAQIRWANTIYDKKEYDIGENNNDENRAPDVNITSPANNAIFTLGEEINLAASASDSDGNIVKVNFKVNDLFYKTDNTKPYENSFTPTEPGSYKLAARAFDNDDAQTETFVTVQVLGPNNLPTGNFIAPADNEFIEGYNELYINFEASDPDEDEIISAVLSIDGEEIRSESQAPYEWGHQSKNEDFTFETLDLIPGTHILKVEVTDARGAKNSMTKTIEVMPVVTGVGSKETSILSVFPNPSESGLFHLSTETSWEIHDVHGQMILSGTGSNVNLSNETRGVYFLRGNKEVIKIVVN